MSEFAYTAMSICETIVGSADWSGRRTAAGDVKERDIVHVGGERSSLENKIRLSEDVSLRMAAP
jgi:hypothetical protein